MNILQFAANVDAAFRQYWMDLQNYEINSTWCSDLVIAMAFENKEPGAIDKTINDAITNWKSNFQMFTDLIVATNWLSWFCYQSENYKQYTDKFSDWYYKLEDIAYENFNKEEKARLYRLLD